MDNDTDATFVIADHKNYGNLTVHGKVMRTNLLGNEIYAYQGIRYAKEPDETTKFKVWSSILLEVINKAHLDIIASIG